MIRGTMKTNEKTSPPYAKLIGGGYIIGSAIITFEYTNVSWSSDSEAPIVPYYIWP